MLENCRRFFEKLLKSPWIWLKLVCINSALHCSLGVFGGIQPVLCSIRPSYCNPLLCDQANDIMDHSCSNFTDLSWMEHARIQRRGSRGSGPPPCKIPKIKGFLAVLVRIPWKKSQSYRASIQCGTLLAHQRNTISMAFCWQADNCPLLVVFGALLPSKKNLSELDPLWQNFLGQHMWKNL